MTQEIYFNKTIEFPGGEKEEIEFSATFLRGGIGKYEHFGFKGNSLEWELGGVSVLSLLDKEKIDFVNKKIDCGDLDSAAWDNFS